MRLLVLLMMSLFTLVGMFAIALGVVYVFFYNDNDDDNDNGKEERI